MRPFTLGLLAFLIACGPPRRVVTVAALVEDPSRYDGAEVLLAGVVENPRRNAGYTSFTLSDGTARVPVIAWGTEEVGIGDTVEVRGAFRSQLHAGTDILSDTVEAKFVRLVSRAVQPPGTPVSPP
ncbi:MAG TPA: OB-fold nucleic acid binding domain-containing protein [Candidatus Nitrosopolaris sp.]|nr:OB-fold nucleic acid binding domain-containing protein [Candidatus Nitrosopolaris sp.]